MIHIPTSFFATNNAESQGKQEHSVAGNSPFDLVLANANSYADLKDLASSFIDHIIRSLDSTLAHSDATSTPVFPFSSEFQAVFGTSGPLLDFINITTSRLNLNADQNLALQMIAVNNKDTTATPEDIQKIAGELRQAGIGGN